MEKEFRVTREANSLTSWRTKALLKHTQTLLALHPNNNEHNTPLH